VSALSLRSRGTARRSSSDDATGVATILREAEVDQAAMYDAFQG
jgi:hypothetical protein